MKCLQYVYEMQNHFLLHVHKYICISDGVILLEVNNVAGSG